jgi:uncharacterized protein (TIGR03435 family)
MLAGIAVAIAATSGGLPGARISAGQEGMARADLAFDVVSIRPSSAAPDQSHLQVLPNGDRYEAIGMPLGWTILMAYFPFHMQAKDQIIGAPGWVWSDRYDFVGKVGPAALRDWQILSGRGFPTQNTLLEAMLQNALASRCKMIVRRVPTQVDGYAMVLAKQGPNRKNLVQSNSRDAIPVRAHEIALGGKVVPIYTPDDPVMHYFQTSMTALALNMSHTALIEDRTGLAGKYNFDLIRLGTGGVLGSDWDLARLGLKLIPAKVPSEKIVIDRIERPSPN